MKIALLGYGKMGRKIEEIASDRGHEICMKVGSRANINEIDFTGLDIAIEFSSPHSAYNNISSALSQGIPVVSGSTGWLEHLEEIEKMAVARNTAFMYASNFSLGVNILFAINEKLAKLLSANKDYNVSIEETHHTTKKDAPSGTAISLANQIIENSSNRFEKWKLEKSLDHIIPITSLRKDNVPGTHIIEYQSEQDSLSLAHVAHNRDGFALGAVLAAEYLIDKKGIHSMQDVLGI